MSVLIRLPTVPENYDPEVEKERNREIEQAFQECQREQTDVFILGGKRIVLQSPDGSYFQIEVDNNGTLSANSTTVFT